MGECCVTAADAPEPEQPVVVAAPRKERYADEVSGLTPRQAVILAHVAAGTTDTRGGKLTVWDEGKNRHVEVGETVKKLRLRGFLFWEQVGVMPSGQARMKCFVTDKGAEALAVHRF